jgi:Na+/phosphate symporter
MRKFLITATTNRFAGVFTGIVATTLLESSSMTIIMVIAMVSRGVLSFVQSLGVVLGSNIGTAVGAQIISLDIKHYVPALMGLARFRCLGDGFLSSPSIGQRAQLCRARGLYRLMADKRRSAWPNT